MERSRPIAEVQVFTLLLCALALCAGCQSMGGPAPWPGAGDALALEADADPDDHMAGRNPLPPSLELVKPPRYGEARIPLHPEVIGTLDVALGRRWNYVVVHHSYSDFGSAGVIDEWHKQRGWLGVGYHFVIGNGNGSPDGAIEATFRWERQIHGAHAGVEQYNQHGIGICLIGNFERDYPTPRQMASLVSLVSYLQERCDIPVSNILLHRHIKATSCPGTKFPYFEFISLLPH